MSDCKLCQARVWDNGDMTACGASMPCAVHATDRKPWREDVETVRDRLQMGGAGRQALERLEAELELLTKESEREANLFRNWEFLATQLYEATEKVKVLSRENELLALAGDTLTEQLFAANERAMAIEKSLERAEKDREHLEYAAEVCRKRIARNSSGKPNALVTEADIAWLAAKGSLMTDRRTAWEQGARQGFFCRPDGDPDPTTLEEVLSYNPYPEGEELLARVPRPNGSRWVPTAELMPTDGQALLFLMRGSPKVWVGRVAYADRFGLFFRTDYGDFMPEVVELWLAVPEPPPR